MRRPIRTACKVHNSSPKQAVTRAHEDDPPRPQNPTTPRVGLRRVDRAKTAPWSTLQMACRLPTGLGRHQLRARRRHPSIRPLRISCSMAQLLGLGRHQALLCPICLETPWQSTRHYLHPRRRLPAYAVPAVPRLLPFRFVFIPRLLSRPLRHRAPVWIRFRRLFSVMASCHQARLRTRGEWMESWSNPPLLNPPPDQSVRRHESASRRFLSLISVASFPRRAPCTVVSR
jgi:hypothetical protein